MYKQRVFSGFSSFLVACWVTTGIAVISASSQQQQNQVKCKNEQGMDVDWFIAYKLPKIRTSSNSLVRTGLAYAYILPPTGETGEGSATSALENSFDYKGSFSRGHDPHHHHDPEPGFGSGSIGIGRELPRNPSTTWILSEKGIDSIDSVVGHTLGKLYLKKKDDPIAFLTYNDQPPVGPVVMTGGHSKGVIVTSLASGFWIQHSVPHFPLIELNNPHYQYPNTGRINGQVFHCISLSTPKDVDNLAKILEITRPHIANSSFPTDSLQNALPQLMAIVNRHRHENQMNPINQSSINNHAQLLSPCVNEVDERACLAQLNETSNGTGKNWDIMEFRSTAGFPFKAFIKGPSFHEDIYSSQLAPAYNTGLTVQSWLNGPNPFQSNCSSTTHPVYNIDGKRIAGQVFSTHNDHSKWALSTKQPLVCISDLNRMEHQLQRGGVTVCFMDSSTWLTFNSSIIDVQPCPRLFSGGDPIANFRMDVDASITGEDQVKKDSHHGSGNDNDKEKWIGEQFKSDAIKHARRSFYQHRRQGKVKRTFSFSTV